MKKMKRNLTVLAAGACAVAVLGSAGALTASAATCGDVNGDGKISLLDTVTLNKYLVGQYELADYSAADTNDDGVLGYIDRLILNDYVVGNIENLPYTG